MYKIKWFLFVFIFISGKCSFSQICTGLGQNPGTAFPVCGTAAFIQTSVMPCGGRLVAGPCTTDAVTDINPYWYKFTCFTAGTLSFLIAPNNASDDYDWQLFDVTGKNTDDVYTDASTVVASNWSGLTGNTGAAENASGLFNCGGVSYPLFSKSPILIVNHQYLLLVSHFSGNSQSGYSLTFGGGSANITDPVIPHLLSAKAACDGSAITVSLNKNMKCNSIDADGSDFIIIPGNIPITAASGVGCSGSFDMDSVTLTLGNILVPGNYKITVRPNNNLLDNCNNFIPQSDTLDVTVYPLVITPMDSLTNIACAPAVLQLVFKDLIRCNSIAADGSDFTITGSATIKVIGATGVCNANQLTNVINVQLAAPINKAGNFTIQLVTGTDGNTIINECGKETPANAAIAFTTKDTVSAVFTSTLNYGCISDTIFYQHDGKNGVNSWQWSFNNTINSTAQNTSVIYPLKGPQTATLKVSNGTCKDSASAILNYDNSLKAQFESTPVVCPGDPAIFVDKSTGGLPFTWQWDFGNGVYSTKNIPAAQYYPSTPGVSQIPVKLTVTNTIGCADTATNIIMVQNNCYIAIPKAFSPNGDGLNDFLYPTNAFKAKDLLFRVFNRNGQKLFETTDWTKKWDGSYKGNPQSVGTYVWILSYTTTDTNKKIEIKGSTVLIR